MYFLNHIDCQVLKSKMKLTSSSFLSQNSSLRLDMALIRMSIVALGKKLCSLYLLGLSLERIKMALHGTASNRIGTG